jgi:uncharacterized integral membrane protein
MSLAHRAPTRFRRPSPARLAAFAVAVVGALLLLLGLARTTIWSTPAHTVVHVAGQPGKPVVVTTADVLALGGPSVRVTVRAADPAQTVFVGVGRASDVDAYLGNAARTEITGVRHSDAVLAASGSDASLPAPASVDVWALATSGRGSATLVWPRADGSWRALAAVDGATPPAQVVVDWQRDSGSSLTPALIAVGGLLLVLGLVGVRATRRRTRARAHRALSPHAQSVVPMDDDEDEDMPVEEAPAPFRSERRS